MEATRLKTAATVAMAVQRTKFYRGKLCEVRAENEKLTAELVEARRVIAELEQQ
jgi:hypothetical protein